MYEDKEFKKKYNKYSIIYSEYLLFTIIGSFWGLNKLIVKDYKDCYERLILGSIFALTSFLFFLFYALFIDLMSLLDIFNFEQLKHFKKLVFFFFVPIFIIMVLTFISNLVKDLYESSTVVAKHNHKIKKLLLKNQTKELDKFLEISEKKYKKLFKYGCIFGSYHYYYGNNKKHNILCAFPIIVSLLLIINLFIGIFCALIYGIYFFKNIVYIHEICLMFIDITVMISRLVLFKLIPVWLCFNLLIILTDYKQISKINIEEDKI